MQATSEIAKLKREIDTIADVVRRGKASMSQAERRQLRSEIEHLVQRLDELRTMLST